MPAIFFAIATIVFSFTTGFLACYLFFNKKHKHIEKEDTHTEGGVIVLSDDYETRREEDEQLFM